MHTPQEPPRRGAVTSRLSTQPHSSAIDQAKGLYMLGVEALAAQRLEDAVMAFREAVDLDPGLERSWHGLAVVMEAMGNPVEAVRCYLKALSANPSDQESRNDLDQLLLQLSLAEESQTQAFTSSRL